MAAYNSSYQTRLCTGGQGQWIEDRKEEEEEGGRIKEWSECRESEVKRERGREQRRREAGRQRRRVMSPCTSSQWESGRERERAAKGGCVFLSLQHQQRGEGHNQFHREEEEKAQVDKEESGRKRGRRELPEEKKHHREGKRMLLWRDGQFVIKQKESGRELVSGLIRLLGGGGLLWNHTFASSSTGSKRGQSGSCESL